MIKVIIIEDEMASQKLLSQIIKDYCPDLTLKGVASSLSESIQVINNETPDIVFMDIELKDTNAFDILDSVSPINFRIIFTTAYEEYALKAFKYDAVDYLLKPYSPKDVINAISRIKKQDYNLVDMSKLQENIIIGPTNFNNNKLSLSTADGISIFNIDDIIRVEAGGSYSQLYLKDGVKYMTSKTLKEIEGRLPDDIFFRLHTSHLININHVTEFKKEDGGFVTMTNFDIVPVSRRKKNAFLKVLSNDSLI